MKLILKTLKQVQHEVEVDSNEITVAELKKKTEEVHKIAAETIKLVFNGTILKDESVLSSYGINEGNVIVMMISKIKIPEKKETKPEEKKEETSSNVNQGSSNSNIQSQPQTQTQTKPQTQNVDYSKEVETLMEMGFPKEYAESAIKAAKGNVTIAIEFLYNGIPENISSNENASQGQNQQSEQGGSQGSGQPGSTLDVVKKIASLVKVLCANDPSQLQNIIMGLQQTQPEIIELIKQHETEFKNLISQPVSEEDIAAFQEFNSQHGLGGQGGHGGQGQGQGGQRQDVIKLSKTEYEAVQRLKEFGFSEMEAAQAYFACDKNEEYALNFLFESKAQDSGAYGDFGVPQSQPQSQSQSQPQNQQQNNENQANPSDNKDENKDKKEGEDENK